jgi:hypothetical protein
MINYHNSLHISHPIRATTCEICDGETLHLACFWQLLHDNNLGFMSRIGKLFHLFDKDYKVVAKDKIITLPRVLKL